MEKRFVCIWFRFLKTDWHSVHKPKLKCIPFVLVSTDHGRLVITAANPQAHSQGVEPGVMLADARAIIPTLEYAYDNPQLAARLLNSIAERCLLFTPAVAPDLPDGLIFDATGCAHLWKGEQQYLQSIITRLQQFGYTVRAAISDTIATSWAITHFGKEHIIKTGEQQTALLPLPPEALQLDLITAERLHKLGLHRIEKFITMPRSTLRRRFGPELIHALNKALGNEKESFIPIHTIEPYQERLPCLEPIVTSTGIEIALRRLLDILCNRLTSEQKGLRMASFKAFRMDGKLEKIEIGTNRATNNATHLFKLFELKINTIEPALGIELFVLEASKIETISTQQEKLWDQAGRARKEKLSDLLDHVTNKVGGDCVHRYLPNEHYWPERSIKKTSSVFEELQIVWISHKRRPIQLLSSPEPIEVTAPIPDYPPMLFRYRNKLHKIIKADGPERIEREWWIDEGSHRDYYCVEDETGNRYWLFRSGHYTEGRNHQWFIHGFFA